MSIDLANIRKEYRQHTLDEGDVPKDPLAFFAQWFEQAVKAGVPEPTAMTLATVDGDGTPSARIVLLKGVVEGEFRFFTNQQSAKAQAIASSAKVALLWFWPELERQIRVVGTASKLTDRDNDEYWQHRPRLSQLGAWASEQSATLTSRVQLESTMREVTARFEGGPVPRPPHWGGYGVRPFEIEFWQGRESRLHDRVLFVRDSSGANQWAIRRLSP